MLSIMALKTVITIKGMALFYLDTQGKELLFSVSKKKYNYHLIVFLDGGH